MVKLCPHCGSIMDRPIFPRVKQRIYDYILKHPSCEMRSILDSVYSDDPDGGPDTCNIISVHLTQMKPTLEANGLRVICSGGPGSTYQIVEIKVPANASV